MNKLFGKSIGVVMVLAFVLSACSLGGGASLTGTSNGSSGSGQSSSYGKTSVPANPVAFTAGQVYQVGQAVVDPSTGVIIEVTGVRYDTSLPGLSAGQTYALVDITLGNSGTQTFSASSLGSFSILSKSSGKTYTESGLIDLLAAKVLNPNDQLDVDVAPGTAFHGLLPVSLPVSDTGLELHFNSLNSDNTMGPTIIISLGK